MSFSAASSPGAVRDLGRCSAAFWASCSGLLMSERRPRRLDAERDREIRGVRPEVPGVLVGTGSVGSRVAGSVGEVKVPTRSTGES